MSRYDSILLKLKWNYYSLSSEYTKLEKKEVIVTHNMGRLYTNNTGNVNYYLVLMIFG